MATGLSTALNNSRVKADCVHLFAIPQYLVGIRLKPYTNRKEKNMKKSDGKSVFFFLLWGQPFLSARKRSGWLAKARKGNCPRLSSPSHSLHFFYFGWLVGRN